MRSDGDLTSSHLPDSLRQAINDQFQIGYRFNNLLEADEILRTDDASRKDDFYLRILGKVLQHRTYQDAPVNAHRFQSRGLTEAIASDSEVNLRPDILRCLLKAMRVDFIMSERSQNDTAVYGTFLSAANRYIDAYLRGTMRHESPAVELNKSWDRVSIADFYKILYGNNYRNPSIGAWLSYEADALYTFYHAQLENSPPSPLTAFDRLVLTNYFDDDHRVDHLTTSVEDSIGISITRQNIFVHRNSLLFGEAVAYPQKS